MRSKSTAAPALGFFWEDDIIIPDFVAFLHLKSPSFPVWSDGIILFNTGEADNSTTIYGTLLSVEKDKGPLPQSQIKLHHPIYRSNV